MLGFYQVAPYKFPFCLSHLWESRPNPGQHYLCKTSLLPVWFAHVETGAEKPVS